MGEPSHLNQLPDNQLVHEKLTLRIVPSCRFVTLEKVVTAVCDDGQQRADVL